MKINKFAHFQRFSIEFFGDSVFEIYSYNIWNPKDWNSKHYGRNAEFTFLPFRFWNYFSFSNCKFGANNKRFCFGLGIFQFFIDYYAKSN